MILYTTPNKSFTSYEEYENYVWSERKEGRFSKLISDGLILKAEEGDPGYGLLYAFRLLHEWEFKSIEV